MAPVNLFDQTRDLMVQVLIPFDVNTALRTGLEKDNMAAVLWVFGEEAIQRVQTFRNAFRVIRAIHA